MILGVELILYLMGYFGVYKVSLLGLFSYCLCCYIEFIYYFVILVDVWNYIVEKVLIVFKLFYILFLKGFRWCFINNYLINIKI